jgi:hypothetical protein
MEHLQDKESKLDAFFLKINESFQKDRTLNRYRNEKSELEKFGKQIVEDLRRELESAKLQLTRYANLEEAINAS